MIEGIKREAEGRGITRVCHFTPSRNLIHIASGTTGILATSRLQADERGVFTPTDLQRFDGHSGHICCSIEYPNAWYFDRARSKDMLFRDWVVLLITPEYLWKEGTRFCARNAAAGCGADIGEGEDAFKALFAESVRGAGGRVFSRSLRYPLCCPTDEQAEVLIPDRISLGDVLGIVVASDSQAKEEIAAFRLAGVDPNRFSFIVAPLFFQKCELSNCTRSGQRPSEKRWRHR